ncbi:MAG: protein kinase domain-containing protein [Polyangiaceae bacterium]
MAHSSDAPTATLAPDPGSLEPNDDATQGLATIAARMEAEAQAREALPEGTRIGRYLILKSIGGGGGGMVYAAYDPELDRRVAVKLLRAGDAEGPVSGSKGRSTAQTRLLREAQAMAKLAHPNVTTVHDVGTYGDLVFIAMELVEGGTLRDRLKSPSPPSRAEALRLMLDAGEGLAAAHAAQLVHRDFKPDNVLVSSDGRARVTDFGLVRAGATEAGGPTATPSADRGAATDTLTQVGTVMGTLPYMAPEQHDALPTDARTDQYSYCVTLWEALYGKRPFQGTEAELAKQKKRQVPPTPPEGASVPSWIRRILERGLSPDPDKRFPDMRSLLTALRDDPAARTRRRLAIGVGVVATVSLVGTSVGFARRAHPNRCGGSEALVAGAWDDGVRAQLRSRFAAAVPSSSAIVASVERTLDAYVSSWEKMRTEACEATRVREEQSENVLLLRTACLDSRLRELRSFTTQLAEADKGLVLKSAQAAGELTSIAPCADVAWLTAVAPLPTEPGALALVHEGEATLSEAHALSHLGKDARAAELAARALNDSLAAHYVPLEARARNAHGNALMESGEHKDAEAEFLSAFARSLAAKDDETATKAATNLAVLETYVLARPAEGLHWAEVAHGALERAGNDEELRAVLLREEVWVHYEVGDAKGAVTLAEEALGIAERLYGKDSLHVANYLNAIGAAYHKAARLDDARKAHERALAISRRELGDEHPNIAACFSNIAELDVEQGDFAAAKGLLEQAVDLQTRIRGPNHPNVAIALGSLGDALAGLDECAQAVPKYERAIAINDAKFGPDYADTAHFLAGLGHCRAQMGDIPGALATLERGYGLVKKADAEPDQAAETRFELALALARKDPKSKRARDLAVEAQALYEKVESPKKLSEVKAWLREHP